MGRIGASSLWRVYLWACLLLQACEAEPTPAVQPSLEAALAEARRTSVAAAIFGPKGGVLAVEAGALAGVRLEVPPGTLSSPAVFSIAATAAFDDTAGYVGLGPTARFASTQFAFSKDLVVVLPVYADFADRVTSPLAGLVRRDRSVYEPVPGSAWIEGFFRGPTRVLGDFGVAWNLGADSAHFGNGSSRCPPLLDGLSLRGVISTTRLHAVALLTEPYVFAAATTTANPCGFSNHWEVTWYSLTDDRLVIVTYQSNHVSLSDGSIGLTCQPAPVSLLADSPQLADQLASAVSQPVERLTIELLNCEDGYNPARIRLAIPGTGVQALFALDGDLVAKTY